MKTRIWSSLQTAHASSPQNFRERLSQEQAKRGFHITGVLLDQDGGAFEFSLAAFCDEIIRTSELTREQVAERLVSSRTA